MRPKMSDTESLQSQFEAFQKGSFCIPVRLHGAKGAPCDGFLSIQTREGNYFLNWNPERSMKITITNMLNFILPVSFTFVTGMPISVSIDDINSVQGGRQTTNFIRTLKYLDYNEIPENDNKCLSLCSLDRNPNASMLEQTYTLDLEFMSRQMRDLILGYFRAKLGITDNESNDFITETSSDLSLPGGWSTWCYQLQSHPLYELTILISVFFYMITASYSGKADDISFNYAVIVEWIVLIILTIEQVVKYIAMEEIKSIFRHKWDVVDAIVLYITWVAMLQPRTSAISDIRLLSIRFLRCLKISRLGKWTRYQDVVNTFLLALPMACNAAICFLCYLALFSIVGVYLFRDALSSECISRELVESGDNISMLPKHYCNPSPNIGGADHYVCPLKYVCSDISLETTQGIVGGGFHSFYSSVQAMLLISMRAGFGDVLDGIVSVSSSPMYIFVMAYFACFVVLVPWMILSLFIGIVRGSYATVLSHRYNYDQHQQLKAQWEAYKLKNRVAFPSYTLLAPDVVEIAIQMIYTLYDQIQAAFYHSVLFSNPNRIEQTNSDFRQNSQTCKIPDGIERIFEAIRLRQTHIFFLLSPNGDSYILRWICTICNSIIFEHTMNIAVIAISIFYALEYYGMPYEYSQQLYFAEKILISVYVLEFILLCAHAGGLKKYLRNPWNRLDFCLLVIAGFEYIRLSLAHIEFNTSYSRTMFVLRLFRLVRPFRVVRRKNDLLRMLNAMLTSIPTFLSLTLFQCLLHLVFAVIGIHLFGGRFPSELRSNFDSLLDSMLTLFLLSCGIETRNVLKAALLSTSFYPALIYFIAYFLVCLQLSSNIMLVVLLRNFAMKEDEKQAALVTMFQENMKAMQRVHGFKTKAFLDDFQAAYINEDGPSLRLLAPVFVIVANNQRERTISRTNSKSKIKEIHDQENNNEVDEVVKLSLFDRLKTSYIPISEFLMMKGYGPRSSPKAKQIKRTNSRTERTKVKHRFSIRTNSQTVPAGNATATIDDSIKIDINSKPRAPLLQENDFSSRWHQYRIFRWLKNLPTRLRSDWLMSDVSCFIFPPYSKLRLTCKHLEKSTDKYIFSCIIIRTALLTIQSPSYSNMLQEFSTATEVLFAIVLFFEFSIKVISRGFLFTPKSYLSNPWNRVNGIVLIACSLLLLLPRSQMTKLFRLGRAFGPIRVFYRVQAFRVITQAIRRSAKQIFFCLLIVLFLCFSFAIMGMQLYAGQFLMCNDPSARSHTECKGFFEYGTPPLLVPRIWGNPVDESLHFDNIGSATASVIAIVTTKSWTPELYRALDIVDHDIQPIKNASRGFALYFITFVLITRFFLLKVFAGVIINNFRAYSGTSLLTPPQLTWLRMKQSIRSLQPKYPTPRNLIIYGTDQLVRAQMFRVFEACLVIVHTIILVLYYSFTDHMQGVWRWHYFFSLVYILDATVCIFSMGWKDFLLAGLTWRTVNSVIALIMLFGPLFVPSNPFLLVIGLTRALDFKDLSLVCEYFGQNFTGLKVLLETLLVSTRQSFKSTLLLGYVVFMFATIAMQLFSFTRWDYGLDEATNFLTFPGAFTSFFKFAAGEEWYRTYLACTVTKPKCSFTYAQSWSFAAVSHPTDCGSNFFSTLFFYCFYIFVLLMLQNLYVANMVDTYVSTSALSTSSPIVPPSPSSHTRMRRITNPERMQKQDTKVFPLLGFTPKHLHEYQELWGQFDHDALGYIHSRHLIKFLIMLDLPLGLGSFKEMVEYNYKRLDPSSVNTGTMHESKLDVIKIVSRQRRAVLEDIFARLAEAGYRQKFISLQHSPLSATSAVLMSFPTQVVRFSDLLRVLTERIVSVECLSVQGKVKEIAVRGYIRKFRAVIRIQTIYRMFHRYKRYNNRKRKNKSGHKGVTMQLPNNHDPIDDEASDVHRTILDSILASTRPASPIPIKEHRPGKRPGV